MAATRVLFIDTHNSARSQMAESMLRTQARGEIEAFSAGLESRDLRPETLTVLGEVGIDTAELRSKSVEEFSGQRFDWVVVIGDEKGENRPPIEGESETALWNIEDPWKLQGDEEERLAGFRRIREHIRQRLSVFEIVARRDDLPGRPAVVETQSDEGPESDRPPSPSR